MKEQLATFRSQLEEFARKHKVIFCVLQTVGCNPGLITMVTVEDLQIYVAHASICNLAGSFNKN
jgi:hypothetical protein